MSLTAVGADGFYEVAPYEKSALRRLALDDQAVAVVFDLMNPVLPGRNLAAARWDARLILILAHQ